MKPVPDITDAQLLALFRAQCAAVGIPDDPAGLVRHHRGNAALTGALDAMTENLALRRALKKASDIATSHDADADGPRVRFAAIHTAAREALDRDYRPHSLNCPAGEHQHGADCNADCRCQ